MARVGFWSKEEKTAELKTAPENTYFVGQWNNFPLTERLEKAILPGRT